MTDLFAHLVAAVDRARATRTRAVRRPQACNCGANPLINVAHHDRCASR